MARGERLRALNRVREKLEHAHSNLLVASATSAMRRWARTVALLLEKVEEEIRSEEERLAQLELDEAEARLYRQEEEERG